MHKKYTIFSYRFLCGFLLPAVFCAVCVLSSCSKKKFNLPTEELLILTEENGIPKTRTVLAELATSAQERNWGFMERKHIPDGTGMLFVFENDARRNFWMRNTPHPLTIAYIGSDGIIYDLIDMTPYSEAPVKSSRSVRFALEVPQGWFYSNGIRVGNRVTRKDGSALTTIPAQQDD